MFRPFVLGTLLGLVCALSAADLSSAQLVQEFRAPQKSVGPMVRWWWPGGDVDGLELRNEIRIMDEAGFAGAEIQAFRIGLRPGAAAEASGRVNDYNSPAFYTKVRAAAEEAAARGMLLDLTLGSGWPFGGSQDITPELASMELRTGLVSLKGPMEFRAKLTLPQTGPSFAAMLAKLTGVSQDLPNGWAERLAARKRTVAVVALRGTTPVEDTTNTGILGRPVTTVREAGQLDPKSAIVLTSRLSADGTLTWPVPEGEWQLFFFVEQPGDLLVIGGAGDGPQLVIDHMRKEALDVHLRRIARSADELLSPFYGKSIRGVFCDSLEVVAELFWTPGFLTEFRQRRGYDLTPWLPFLRVPGQGDPYSSWASKPRFDAPGAERAREDYWLTVSELWMSQFFTPLNDWAHQRKLLSRVQAHGAPTDVLTAYGAADIPETEQLYAEGSLDFLKVASSAAHQNGRKLVAAEAFVHAGRAYASTRTSLESDTNALIAAGINQIVYHGFPYVYMDRPDPGWFPFASPIPFSDHFNPKAKIWADVPALNRYIARLQTIAQNGTPIVRYAWLRTDLDYPNRAREAAPPTLDYDHISKSTLDRSRVVKGRLVVPSGFSYEALVLPVDDKSIRRKFAGLRIITGAPPASTAPTRWRVAGSEFLFYFNPGKSSQTYALDPGRYERWDAWTGEITPYPAGQTLMLTPGNASLLRRLP